MIEKTLKLVNIALMIVVFIAPPCVVAYVYGHDRGLEENVEVYYEEMIEWED